MFAEMISLPANTLSQALSSWLFSANSENESIKNASDLLEATHFYAPRALCLPVTVQPSLSFDVGGINEGKHVTKANHDHWRNHSLQCEPLGGLSVFAKLQERPRFSRSKVTVVTALERRL